MDATLVIIGVNFHTSPVAIRERFWIPPDEQVDALHSLVRSEGIEEVVVLATCARTEFILWASDPTEGANSVLRFLTRKFDLKLSDWSNFYRLVDNTALLHLFRVAAGLDSISVGEPEIGPRVKTAWQQAQRADTCGRFLDATMQKALDVSMRANLETSLASSAVSISSACVELGTEVFGSIDDRAVLLLGAGEAALSASHYLHQAGARKFAVLSRKPQEAEQLMAQFEARIVEPSQLVAELSTADIVIAATSSSTFILGSSDLAAVMTSRKSLPLLLIDLGLPRNIDPDVRGLAGVIHYDLDGLEEILQRNTAQQHSAVRDVERILTTEVQAFHGQLLAEQDLPTIVALRRKLEEICGQELRSLEDQFGPFTEDQQHALHSLASHITQRIAGGMARKLKELPEQADQQKLTEAMQRLFHLQTGRRTSSVQSN